MIWIKKIKRGKKRNRGGITEKCWGNDIPEYINIGFMGFTIIYSPPFYPHYSLFSESASAARLWKH